MKTNFRPRSNTSYRKRLVLIMVVLVGGMLIFVLGRQFIFSGAMSVWKGSNIATQELRNMTQLIESKESLIAENNRLNQELASYNTLLQNDEAVKSSEETLLETFGRTASSSGEIAASITVHPPETPYDVLVIDAGSAEGIKASDRVWLPEGGLIGNVVEVSLHSSRVVLYSGNDIKTDAVLERFNVPVTLIGHGGGTFEFDVPKGVQVVQGDRILAPGIKGDLLGVVEDISTSPSDSALHVLVKSIANVSSVRFVVVTP